MYRTTLPLIKIFFTELKCGYFNSSSTVMSSSLMFKYWSTDLSVPRMQMSFFSSTVTTCCMRVLKKLKGASQRPETTVLGEQGPGNLPEEEHVEGGSQKLNGRDRQGRDGR